MTARTIRSRAERAVVFLVVWALTILLLAWPVTLLWGALHPEKPTAYWSWVLLGATCSAAFEALRWLWRRWRSRKQVRHG